MSGVESWNSPGCLQFDSGGVARGRDCQEAFKLNVPDKETLDVFIEDFMVGDARPSGLLETLKQSNWKFSPLAGRFRRLWQALEKETFMKAASERDVQHEAATTASQQWPTAPVV